jgi:hypothetical protein
MKTWLTLSLLLVFGAGLGVGFVSGLLSEGGASPAPAGPLLSVSPYDDNPPYLLTSADFYDQIGVSPLQRERIEELLSRYYGEVRKVRSEMGDVVLGLRRGIEELLDEEQRQKLAAIQKGYDETESQHFVMTEMVQLRKEVGLSQEQEGPVYHALMTCALERRNSWKEAWEKAKQGGEGRWDPEIHKRIRESHEEAGKKRDARLTEILSAPQFEAYKSWKERQRRRMGGPRPDWRPEGGDDRHSRKGRGGRDRDKEREGEQKKGERQDDREGAEGAEGAPPGDPPPADGAPPAGGPPPGAGSGAPAPDAGSAGSGAGGARSGARRALERSLSSGLSARALV